MTPLIERFTFFFTAFTSYWIHLRKAEMVLRLIATQIYFTAVEPLRILLPLSFVAGALVMMQASDQLSILGGIQTLGEVLVFSLFREVIPLIVLLVVIGRSVTAISTELATMKVQGEFRLYRAHGIPIEGLIYFPRLIGPALGVTGLTVICVLAAYFGAILMAILHYKMNFSVFTTMIVSAITPFDFICFALKATLIPLVVFTIAVYEGSHLKAASFEVPIIAIRSVMQAYVSCVVMFFGVSILFYLKEGIPF
jgi:phospholipid/cholesterol/gamma-HCH transport system permease protein